MELVGKDVKTAIVNMLHMFRKVPSKKKTCVHIKLCTKMFRGFIYNP